MLKKVENYEDVSSIYNRLRIKYESYLSYIEASDFYVSEMETTRKKLSRRGKKGSNWIDKMKSVVFEIYKLLNFYGESTFIPLLVWSPATIIIFMFLRISLGECGNNWPSYECAYIKFVESLSAFFQFPINDDSISIIERVVSLPLLGIAIKSFALTKRFETAIR